MKNEKAIPGNYNTLTTYITVKGADKAIEFYKNAFGAIENGRISMPGNIIGHAELQIGDSRLMLAEEMPEWGNKSPQSIGGTPVGIHLLVDDVDAVFKKALNAGAKVDRGMEPKDQFYGDRTANIVDPFGHQWIIATHKKDMTWEEMQEANDEMMKAMKTK